MIKINWLCHAKGTSNVPEIYESFPKSLIKLLRKFFASFNCLRKTELFTQKVIISNFYAFKEILPMSREKFKFSQVLNSKEFNILKSDLFFTK